MLLNQTLAVKHYTVYIDDGIGGAISNVACITSSLTVCRVKNLIPGRTYKYHVAATNING